MKNKILTILILVGIGALTAPHLASTETTPTPVGIDALTVPLPAPVGIDAPVVPHLSGTIESLNFQTNTLTILDYKGKTHTIQTDKNTKLQINNIKKSLQDLYFGQEVDIHHKNKIALQITGYTEEDPELDGYIMPGSRFKKGEILFISNNQIEIKTNQGREKYRITPNTINQKRGSIININQVKEGDKVVLTFNSIYTSEVAAIKIEDEEKNISGILRGKIELVDERNKEIIIRSPFIYEEGKWIPHKQYYIKIKTTGNDIYNGSQKIQLGKLGLFKGREAYIAYDESYGRMNLAKLTIKNGLAQSYQGKPSNIKYTTGQIVVDNNLMNFNEGTIVIKDNRLVNPLNIDRNNKLTVTVDNIIGRKDLSIVSITTNILDNRIDDTKISIYRGKIEDIYDYEIEIGKINYRLDYLMLQDQKWKEVKDNQRFSMSEDTLIYDSELKETIDPISFISSRFTNWTDIKNATLRDRLKNNYYKNKQAYFVVRESSYGNELLSINLTPHRQYYSQNVKLNHSTQGEIKSIDYDNGTITLIKIKNYNTLNNTWENAADETMDINKSIILLNDLPLPIDKSYNLRVGAKVYAIKEKINSQDEGHVLIIED